MICFEITINGKKNCIAGVGIRGVLHAMTTLSSRDNTPAGNDHYLEFRVGGAMNLPDESTERVEWISQSLSVGDTIEIRIIEAAEADEPVTKEIRYLQCGFCGKKESEVAKLIAGPNTYICNECIVVCAQTIREGISNEKVTLFSREQDSLSCAFCGKQSVEVTHIVGVQDTRICNECIAICNEILAEVSRA